MRVLLTATIAFLLCAENSGADVVVASNFPATMLNTNGWEEVGLIAPAYNNYNNVSKGQSFIPSASGFLTRIDTLSARVRSETGDNYPCAEWR